VRSFLAWQVASQVEDGIADKLSGAVVRHIAAAIHLVQLDALARQQCIACQDVLAPRVAAERQDGRVLK
jgi:hypothetical protein